MPLADLENHSLLASKSPSALPFPGESRFGALFQESQISLAISPGLADLGSNCRTAIPPGSMLHRLVHGDDAFRNSRFKVVNRIVKGPWIVKAAVGNYSASLLGWPVRIVQERDDEAEGIKLVATRLF